MNSTILSKKEWLPRRNAFLSAVSAILEPHLARRSNRQAHPVFDFLFTYYSFSPKSLKTWSPGGDVLLEDGPAELLGKGFIQEAGGIVLPSESFPESRRQTLVWTTLLLEQTAARSPIFGCHGLHEWAMVYRVADDRRHGRIPLRLPAEQVNETVESLPLACTHFDAFRFFAPEAESRNRWLLSRATQPQFDQPGCIHVNMDLYRHAYKLYPFIASELLLEAFALALDAREVDMRASPYDLSEYGYEPIRIETAEGRVAYGAEQARLATKGTSIRARLLAAASELKRKAVVAESATFSSQPHD